MPPPTLFEIVAPKDHDAHTAFLVEKSFVASGRADPPPHPFWLPFDWNADPFNDRKGIFQDRNTALAKAAFSRQGAIAGINIDQGMFIRTPGRIDIRDHNLYPQIHPGFRRTIATAGNPCVKFRQDS